MDRVLTSVRRLARLTQRDPDLPELHRALGDELLATLGADQVHLLGLAAQAPVYGTVVLRNAGTSEYVLAPDAAGNALAWVARTASPVYVPDARIAGTLPDELVTTYGVRSAIVLPLESEGTVRGLVVCGSRVRRDWADDEVAIAGTLVDVAAGAMTLRDARLAASIDPLTECLNHGAMLSRLGEETERARRQRTPLAVLLLDLDDFKSVNDNYGHPTGDALLRAVGETLRHEYRSFDQVARYGGDEFLVILPNVRGPRADIAASRALRLLRELHIELPGGEVAAITVSCGIAEWKPGETVGDLLEKVDVALRSSKAAGKDGVGRSTSVPRIER